MSTLAEHYGIPADEDTVGAERLELAGRNGSRLRRRDRKRPRGPGPRWRRRSADPVDVRKTA